MYRLLIVDDEQIIVDGLHLLFQELNTIDLDINCAYDAHDAQKVASEMRIDIVLSDIAMPGMNGFELQQEITRQWPRCRFIFLSGYNDFQFIQSSLRGGAVDYVLKTEGDNAIIRAVEKTVRQIEAELQQEQLIGRARQQLQQTLPVLRREYLLELLEGAESTPESRSRRFRELAVPLQPAAPVILTVGRVDAWPENLHPGDKELFLFSINNIFEDYFAGAFHCVYVLYAHHRFAWIMQPAPGAKDQSRELIRFVQGTIESIQAAIKTYLKLPCSFIAASQPCSWEELPETLDRFSVLFASGLGTGSEMLLTDRPALGASGRQERVKINRIHLLGSYLDRKEQERFYALFDDIMESVPVHFGVQTGIALEVFYSLTAIFSGYLNRRNLFDEISPHINMKQLYAIQEHASWPKATAFFRLLAALIFAYSDNANERETNEVIRKLHDYMDSHLDEPLSLNQLSEVVYLTSSYLSRLYKQKTGHSITDSITTRKITEAKRLLTETNRKIQEIGEQIGYGSPSYFSRFFKRETEMTPQEYRDAFRST